MKIDRKRTSQSNKRKALKVIFIFLIILIALSGLVFYFINFRKSNTTVLLPALYTDGPYIKRSDNMKVVKLKGVASLLYDSKRFSPFSSTLQVLSNELRDWPINVLRVSYDAEEITEFYQYQDLDKLVNYAQARGIYIILDPRSINYKMPLLPDEKVSSSLQFLVDKYKYKKHVLYGFWSQPADVPWERWMSQALELATVVREINPHAVLVLTGTDWSKNFTFLKNNPFPFDNVIFDVRDFYRLDKDTRQKWIWMVKKYPVLVGAFRGAYSSNLENCSYRSECDLNYIKETLKIVNENTPMVHYTFETLDLLKPNNNLSILGKIILEDMKSSPPTIMFKLEREDKNFIDKLTEIFSSSFF